MFGAKFQRKYALTDQGVQNTKKGTFWTVLVNLVVMGGVSILYLVMSGLMETLTDGTALPAALPVLAGKTVLVIAHRMRTVAGADHIVVLKDGKVAQQGSPQALMAEGGLFRHMVELQSESAQWQLSGARP